MSKKNYLKVYIALAGLAVFLGSLHLIFEKRHSLVDLPLTFDAYKVPIVKTKIGDKEIDLMIDLGAKNELYVSRELLDLVDKDYSHVETWRNIKGESFKRDVFVLPEISLGRKAFQKIMAVERCSGDDNATILSGEKKDLDVEPSQGILGRAFLKKFNILLDFEYPRLLLLKNKFRNIKGYNFKDFHKIPFEIGKEGMKIQVDTDVGQLLFVLDTGSTMTLVSDRVNSKDKKITNSQYGLLTFKTKKLVLEGLDYGELDLHRIQMAAALNDIDGILGMDFLKKHVMYIDFKSNALYLKHSKKMIKQYN